MFSPKIRKGQPDPQLNRDQFMEAFKKNFFDPKFNELISDIDALANMAWDNYCAHRKAPVTAKAGPEFKDPNYDLSVEWSQTRQTLLRAQEEQKTSTSRILLINASPRNEHTCPSEESKSFRLAEKAKKVFQDQNFECELLDLSLLTSAYGKKIYPCKACVSTAMPLCHWPCSCYPNHGLNQTQDWMAEIYEMWTRAHGIMIISPTHWYQVPSVLKLMMDRLVCADGGNADPTTTQGKDPVLAKKIELAGWDYPKHLEGRAFSVVVHGDAGGVQNVRRTLADWLSDIGLIQAGGDSLVENYVGYYRPYATSHDELDKSEDFIHDVETAALSLVHQVSLIRSGQFKNPDDGLRRAMQK